MAPRHVCPSMGAMRRSLIADTLVIPKCSSRAIHSTGGRLEEQPGNAAPSTPAPANPASRRDRSATALRQITNLRNRSVQPRRTFPASSSLQRGESVPYDNPNFGVSRAQPDGSTNRAPQPRYAKLAARPTTTHGAPRAEGQMARAPGGLKITRTAVGEDARGPPLRGGPNLRGRSAGPGRPRGTGGNRVRGPKKRINKKDGDQQTQSSSIADVDPASTLSDGMVHHLLRLQRKEWDRVPYEPKYAPGSFAAQQLIHEGRELFRGENPPVKIWGELEKRIGVVGMFGAEAHLKVQRVADGDGLPFGREHEQDEMDEKKRLEREQRREEQRASQEKPQELKQEEQSVLEEQPKELEGAAAQLAS